MALFVGFELLAVRAEVNGEVGDLEQRLRRPPQLRSILASVLKDNSPGENEVAVEPSMPQTSSIARH